VSTLQVWQDGGRGVKTDVSVLQKLRRFGDGVPMVYWRPEPILEPIL
jgi:hypothetical protein